MSIYLPSVTKYADLKAVLLELNHSEKKKGKRECGKLCFHRRDLIHV